MSLSDRSPVRAPAVQRLGLSNAARAYFFLAPLLALIAVFYVLPTLVTVPIAVSNMGRTLEWSYVGLRNFARMTGLADFLLPGVVYNTAVFVVGSLVIGLGLSLLLALLSTQIGGMGSVFRTLWFLPRATPPVVWGYLWIWTFDPTELGLLNSLLRACGLAPRSWLTQFPLEIVILASAVLSVPYAMTILAAALATIPGELEEAARIDGAREWQIALRIKIPLLRWHLAFLTIWNTLAFMTEFQYILIITGGGPFYASATLSLYIYERAFRYFELGYGAALALILIALSLAVIGLYWKVFRLQAPAAEVS